EDVWYEAEKVWLVQKEGFALGQSGSCPGGLMLGGSEGRDGQPLTPSAPQVNPPQFDRAEDLASLPSLNEASALHTLRQRYQSQLLYTYAGPDLVALGPHVPVAGCSRKAFRGRQDGLPPHIFAVAQRALWNMQLQRQDQTILPLGRSGSGRTACCQQALEYLAATAGSVDDRVTVEKIQAMFRVLGAFGAVSTGHSDASTRFSMLMALDFGPSGRITAAHLQTLLLEKIRVAQQPEGESSFNVFAQMLAGLDLDQRYGREGRGLGLADEKQKASAAFAQLRAAMGTLGISAGEQGAIWRVLAGIYHLGAAGACRVGRKQFMRFEWAGHAAEALGCDFEELTTAVFKHHLRRIIEQATSGAGGQLGPKLTGLECVEGMASGLYEELFAAVVSLINRSFSSSHLSTASIMVVDTPGFHNPRHQKKERAATFEEFCHNYAHERLQGLFHQRTFLAALERYQEEKIEVAFDLPELSPAATVAIADQNSSQVHVSAGGQADGPKGLLWILDEEALIPGSSDSAAVQRLCSYFAREGLSDEGRGPLRKCEQELQFEVAHQLGRDPVRYDAAGWVRKGKWNLSAQNAAQLLQQSIALRDLFLPRAKVPLACRAVAGLEGAGQAALRRVGCVRKTFSSSFAAVRKRSVCAQIKLQLDAIINLVKRSQIHFVHCLVPRTEAERAGETPLQPCGGPGGASMAAWDILALRVQLSGGQILDAIRLHRIGFADRMALPQFRRRFQILAQPVMKKYTSAYEMTDESKVAPSATGDLPSPSSACRQVFLKAGVLPRLEKQREKLVSQNLPLLQAACKGFLSRQRYKKLKIQHLAARCIQKNLAVFQAVRGWPWWRLLCGLRPLLTASLAEGQLRAKEELLTMLRKKLENSELSRQELQQSTEALETKVVDLMAELSDERAKGDVVCQVMEAEQAERLRGAREVAELQVRAGAGGVCVPEARRRRPARAQGAVVHGVIAPPRVVAGDEWQMRLDCAETEIGFLRKRVSQLEERLEQEQAAKQELEQKLREAQKAHEGARRMAQQLQRKSKQLACDLEDARLLFEEGPSGKSRWCSVFLSRSPPRPQQKESENTGLSQRIALLASQVQELGSLSDPGANAAAALQKRLWDLESRASEQQQELSVQAGTVEQLEQLHMRLELEMERMKQLHQKALEDKEEELEDVRQSCQKRLRQLEMQREQECEEKQTMLREKRDLEGLIATLCEQIGHRDFDVEKRLRRDLKRTHALLADVQLLLQTSGADPGAAGSKVELEKLRGQWEESVARCAEAEQSQKLLAAELEGLRTELEVDEQLYQLQHEKADLLKHLDEDQEDLNELMAKHKALIAQVWGIGGGATEAEGEPSLLREQLQVAQGRVAYLEQAMVERSVVSRQEALICDLQNKMEFQSVQIKRFEMLVLRLRDSVIKMGEELETAKENEAREGENAQYYQVRMEEMKADMNELVQRELEASRRRIELEKQVEELSAVRQTLQADLETSIRRIADLQAALEEVHSSDESDTESPQAEGPSRLTPRPGTAADRRPVREAASPSFPARAGAASAAGSIPNQMPGVWLRAVPPHPPPALHQNPHPTRAVNQAGL
uniref:Myosin XVIIIB n=1 Tax=Varanus komodoensis TaxID=61221 RepID=A0A8D2LWH8_VARKO